MSDWRLFWVVLVRDPYLFAGLVFLFVPTSVSSWRIYRELHEVGFKYKSRFTLPAIWWEALFKEYARRRAEQGWPAWPLHAMWLSFLIGIPMLVIGLLKLPEK